jgi:arylsulfatase B
VVSAGRVAAAIALLLLVGSGGCGFGSDRLVPPNLVVLLADDLGWNDVGYHGGFPRTPEIDAFVAGSLELDRFYVAPWCTPSRAGLMTGRFPHRDGMVYVPDFRTLCVLQPHEQTLARVLADAGYPARALVGKWHLGSQQPGQHPLEQGFTHFYGALGGMVDYFDHRSLRLRPGRRLVRGRPDWYRGHEPNGEVGYGTDLIAHEAVSFVEANAGQRFFLFVAFTAPHLPLQATAADLEDYGLDASLSESKEFVTPSEADNRRIYAAMVTSMDRAIGRILTALDALALAERTLVLFVSDNGGYGKDGVGDNSPLRGRKNTLWEGGIRVPAAVRWPGVIPVGRSEELIAYVDLLPTLRRVVGLDPQAGEDGLDVLDVLRGIESGPDRILYYGPRTAVSRDWKLIDGQLFDLRLDPVESRDLAEERPEVVASLLEQLREVEARGR